MSRAIGDVHMGRSWSGHDLEDECPCPKERCGLIHQAKADPECLQHGAMAAKTMRQFHGARHCPARPAPIRWWVKLSDTVAARWNRRRLRRGARWQFDWRHPRASLGMALGLGPDADGQAQWEIVSRVRWAASRYLCIGQWFWDGKDDCWRCGAQPSDIDFLMRRVGFRKAECIDTDGDCKLYAEEVATQPNPSNHDEREAGR